MEETNPEKQSLLLRFMVWLQNRENQTAFYAMEWLLLRLYRRRIQATIDALDQSIRERGIPDTIEEYAEKFKHAPLGRWNSSIECGPWPNDVWEFYANGTGKIFQYCVLDDNVFQFEWQEVANHTIKFRVTDWGDLAEEQDEAIEWETIVYDFKTIDYYGPTVVMFQVPEDDVFKFWPTTDYLHFEGDIKA